jgi:[FeFe] hydrogenase H-cluster maturation GTPase HydF
MGHPLVCGSATATDGRSAARARFREGLLGVVPADLLAPPALVGDLLPAGGLAVLVTPIDLQAPKGRLIQPQVQTIRDALDTDAAVMVVKEREFRAALARLKAPPDLVVCDSQVVAQVVAETPKDVPVTTFSILFSRLKGDLATLVRGAAAVDQLQAGDKVLIAEACSHHALEDDIARVKIPRWLRQYTGCALDIHHCAGHDTPDDLEAYRLVIHCGGCMINRREMLSRLSAAQAQGVAMTNYGVCIAKLQGVLPRVLAPFPHLAVEAAPHQPIA